VDPDPQPCTYEAVPSERVGALILLLRNNLEYYYLPSGSIRQFSRGKIILVTEYKSGSAVRYLLPPLRTPLRLLLCEGGWRGRGRGSSVGNSWQNFPASKRF